MKNTVLLLGSLVCFFSVPKCQPIQLLPTIPDYSTNVQAASMWSGVQLSNPSFKTILTPSLYDEVLYASMSYFHPQSPYRYNPLALKRTLTLLDSMLTNWSINRYTTSFNYTVEATFAYLLLKTYLPDSIPTARKSIWEKGIANLINETLKKTYMYDSLKVGSVWLNGDIRFAIATVFGGTAIGDTLSARKARNVIENVMTRCLLGDGGTHYYGYQNENFTYHTATKKYFLIYWIFTQNPVVLKVLKAMTPYPLLMQHPVGKGFGEYIATAAWKPYYNSNMLEYAAAISAYLTNDPYSWSLGKNAKAFELAFIWKSGLKALSVPTDFLLYDKNILGPRLRRSNWGAVGTLRDMASGAPELPNENISPLSTLMAGKPTLAGAYVLNANVSATTYPINAVLNAVAPIVKTKTGKETDYNRGAVNAFLTGFENNSITMARTVYGIASRHAIVDRVMSKTGFDGMQQWVFTQDRLMGMVELEALANSTCYGLGARFCFVGGRLGVSGKYKPLTRLNDSGYQYGLLNLRIVHQDFKGRTDSVYYGIQGGAGDTLSNQLTLHDQLDSVNDKKITVPKGYRKKVMVEVTKSTTPFAANASMLNLPYPLYGFQFTESNNRKVRIVHNVSNAPVAYIDTFRCPYSATRILKSWNMPDSGAFHTATGSVLLLTVTIPAFGHVLILNSSQNADTVLGHNTFDSIFVGNAPLPVFDIQLNGTNTNCRTTVRFTNEEETDIESYQVQGSFDGQAFITLATILPHENGLEKTRPYQTEIDPSNGSCPFFRISATNKTGQVRYSKTLYVANDCDKSGLLTVYPNPARAKGIRADYRHTAKPGAGTLRLFLANGKIAREIPVTLVQGKNHFDIPTNDLPKGVYYVSLMRHDAPPITKQIEVVE